MAPRASTLDRLSESLGHRFARPEILERALTHASAAPAVGANYERLEFLGDRVLGLVVAALLLERYPDESQGDLARRHAALVRREALAEVARGLDLGRYLRVSRSETDTGGRDNPATLADACEAVLAAVFLDGGLEAVRRLVAERWAPLFEAASRPPRDAKTALQEWAQARGLPLPEYVTLASEGPPHEPVFEIEVRLRGHAPAQGRGGSKRLAEQRAAEALLRSFGETS